MARSVFWADPSKLRSLVDEVSGDPKGTPGDPDDSGPPWRSEPERDVPVTEKSPEPERVPAPKVDWARARASAQVTKGPEGAEEDSEDGEGAEKSEARDSSEAREAGSPVPGSTGSTGTDAPAEQRAPVTAEPEDESKREPGEPEEALREQAEDASTRKSDDSGGPTSPMTARDIGGRLDLVIGMAQERCGAERVFVGDSSGLPMRTSGHDDADFVASAALASRYFEQMRGLLQVEEALAGDLIFADGRHVVLIESDTPAGSIVLGFESNSAPSPQTVQQLQRSLRYALMG